MREITIDRETIIILQGKYHQIRELREAAHLTKDIGEIIGKTDKYLEGMLYIADRTLQYVANVLEQQLPQSLESLISTDIGTPGEKT